MIKSKKLEDWKKAMDKKAAEGTGPSAAEIAAKASARGTALHSFCEQYILNKDVTELLNKDDPLFTHDKNYVIFKRVKEVLDRDLDDVLGIEIPLFSKRLLVAGTPDVIAHYKKKPAIIDFKTIKSGSKITAERILKYFLQGVFYSIMVKELYDIDIDRVVLIFGTEIDEPPTVLNLEIKNTDIERVERLAANFQHQLPTNSNVII